MHNENYLIKGDTLEDIADAIREKTGSQDTIAVSDFASEIENIPSSGPSTKNGYTGNYDSVGLSQIGWTAEDIQYYQENGVKWNEDLDNFYKLQPDELQGVVNSTTRFMPKNTTLTSFDYRNRLIALPYLEFNNKTNWGSMFRYCYNLITIPLFDTKDAIIMQNMFDTCYNLRSIPLLNTSNVTSTYGMFSNCHSLESVPLIDTKNVTNMKEMFRFCISLRSIPQFNTEKVTTMQSMFNGCYALTDIPILDTGQVTNFQSTFSSCSSLNENSLNNILKMCIDATSYAGTKTLSYLGLTSTDYPATKIQALSNYQDFINAGWTIGY